MPSSPAAFTGRRLLALSYLRVAVIVFFVAVLPTAVYLKRDSDAGDRVSLIQRREACDRTNTLRRVVDEFIRTAAAARRESGDADVATKYIGQSKELRAVPFTRPGSAEVECVKAIPK